MKTGCQEILVFQKQTFDSQEVVLDVYLQEAVFQLKEVAIIKEQKNLQIIEGSVEDLFIFFNFCRNIFFC